jgi:hypothetical protein
LRKPKPTADRRSGPTGRWLGSGHAADTLPCEIAGGDCGNELSGLAFVLSRIALGCKISPCSIDATEPRDTLISIPILLEHNRLSVA